MTDNHQKVINEFMNNVNCYSYSRLIWVNTIIKGFGHVKRMYHGELFEHGAPLILSGGRSRAKIQIAGVGKINTDQLSDSKLDILTEWMQKQLDFLNEIKELPCSKDTPKDTKICLYGMSTNATRICFSFPEFNKIPINLLKTALSTLGVGIGQNYKDVFMLRYNPEYYKISRLRRWLYNARMGLSRDVITA